MQPAVQSMQALVRRYYLVFMDFVIGGIIGGIHSMFNYRCYYFAIQHCQIVLKPRHLSCAH